MSKTKESEVDQQQFWQMVIETWKSSGSSIRNFCKQEGLSEPAFYSWRRKLTACHLSNHSQDVKSQPAFIEVKTSQSNYAVLELVLSSGNILRISSGADQQTLNKVLSVLHQVGLC